MFDTFNGLPVHPLVVHVIVVMLPLAVLGTIAIALRPAWRLKYGPLVVASAAVATGLIPIATSSGEALENRVGDPGQHAQLGDQLIWFAIPLLVLALGVVLGERLADRGRGTSRLRMLVAGLAIVAAGATAVQVYRVGDSGARSVWGEQTTSSSVQNSSP